MNSGQNMPYNMQQTGNMGGPMPNMIPVNGSASAGQAGYMPQSSIMHPMQQSMSSQGVGGAGPSANYSQVAATNAS